MEWIICQLNPRDIVKYSISDHPELLYLSYHRFLEYLKQFNIRDFIKFKKEINKYSLLLIDINERTWSIQQPNYSDPNFDNLVKLNQKEDQEESSFFEKTSKVIKNLHDKYKSKSFMD